MSLAAGEGFAGYTVVRLLASDGIGEVYLAKHPQLARQDALWVLPADASADEQFRARFTRDADIAATLWHPHVVGVHGHGEDLGRLWLATDFVDGRNAARVVAEHYPNGMPAEEVVEIVTAVADALDYARGRHLLHHDVTLTNILLTPAPSRRILLTGFGIARRPSEPDDHTVVNVAVGAQGSDDRADQFDLAAAAYHLFSGVPRFAHPLGHTRPDLATFDPALARALAADPAARFNNCLDFAAALRDGLAGLASTVARPALAADEPTATTPVAPLAPTTTPVAPLAPTTTPVAPLAPTTTPVAPLAPTTTPVAPLAPTTTPVAPLAPTTTPVAPLAPTTSPVAPLAPTPFDGTETGPKQPVFVPAWSEEPAPNPYLAEPYSGDPHPDPDPRGDQPSGPTGRTWAVAALAAAAVVVVIGLIVLLTRGGDEQQAQPSSPPPTADTSRLPPPSETTSAPGTTTANGRAAPTPVTGPDGVGEYCLDGYQITGQDVWASHGVRGNPAATCTFVGNVLKAYWDAADPSDAPRTVVVEGAIPCGDGAQCSGDQFVVTCAVEGSDPWVTCRGGRDAVVFLY